MTVCIAGLCMNGTIVAVSDMMVSTGYFSADNMAMKFRDLHPEWVTMFAGNDVTRVGPLCTKARQRLTGSPTRSMAEVEEVMRTCFHEELIQKQTDMVLARYGLTMKDFLDTGLPRFGESLFTTIKYQIDQIELDCTFLVFGRDDKGLAHIFTVEDPGIACNHDLYGVWAIGSGSNRALSSLFFQEYMQSVPEWQALYYLAEAKFMAEGGAVGEHTLTMIRRQDGSVVGSLDMDPLKKLWDKKGKPRRPAKTEEVIKKLLEVEFFPVRKAKQSAAQTSAGQQ
jgi:hypothetical protein